MSIDFRTNEEPEALGEFSQPPAPVNRRLTRGQLVRRRFFRNRGAVVGLAVIGVLVLLAVFGSSLLPWQYDQRDVGQYYKAPSARHLFGTTQAGFDVMARTVRGLGKSLVIGFMVAVIQTTLAALVGSSAAYLGGWYEKAWLWVIDLMLVLPSFFLIAVISQGGPKGSYAWLLLVVLLAAFGWQLSARVVRSLSMSVKEREYVAAARFMGLSTPRLLVRHIVPNIASMLIVDVCLGVGYAILGEAGLSYFGYGVQAPDTSLGTLIAEGALSTTIAPWIFLAPASVLVLLVMSVNALGDGLRDALDPTSMAGGQA
ncbi:MAG: ABC transporter permease [Actinobacteria bacterium]|nr:ABC transporter permease [Actinomycetota bacterium]